MAAMPKSRVVTEELTPEQVAEAIADRQTRVEAAREPTPDRVVFAWPDDGSQDITRRLRKP